MAAATEKSSLADAAGYGQGLSFRSREAAHFDQHVSCAPITTGKELTSYIDSDLHAPDTENVKSWLGSSSPTSVLTPQDHPIASPVCSPSASSPLSSPRSSMVQPQRKDISSSLQTSSNPSNFQAQSSSNELKSTSRRFGKDIAPEAPPDSPTRSSFSLSSEGGLLALLARKLLSNRDNGCDFSHYARGSSGPIDEKHVMEHRSKKPPMKEIHMVQPPSPVQEPSLNSNDLYRSTSEGVSEANDRTLNMEFDNMLAAAVPTGIVQASTQQLLPEIQEDDSFGVHDDDDAGSRALVRVDEDVRNEEAIGLNNALMAVTRQDSESEDLDFYSTLSDWSLSSHSSMSSGSRRGILEGHNNMQIVPVTPMLPVESLEANSTLTNINMLSSQVSMSGGSNGDHCLAMVPELHGHESGTASDFGDSMLSSASRSSDCKDKNMALIATIPASKALEKVRRDKVIAQALAFQDAKCAKFYNRYKREESKIISWENQQRIKASIRMKKVEMRLEQKRAKALEKMQNEIAWAHKRAEERKANAEAVRAVKTVKVTQLADSFRRTGKISSSTNVGCFPF